MNDPDTMEDDVPIDRRASPLAAAAEKENGVDDTDFTAEALLLERKELIKNSRPKPYSGERNPTILENFVWRLRQYISLLRTSPEESVRLAQSFLQKDAQLFWKSVVGPDSTTLPTCANTLDKFCQLLTHRFLPRRYMEQTVRELVSLRMKPGQCQEYIRRFHELVILVPDLSDSLKLYYFMNGLPSGVQQQLSILSAARFEDVIPFLESQQMYSSPIGFPKPSSGTQSSSNENDIGVVPMDVDQFTTSKKKLRFEKNGNMDNGGQWNKRPQEQQQVRMNKGEQAAGAQHSNQLRKVKCWHCHRFGHTRRFCRKRQKESVSMNETSTVSTSDGCTRSNNAGQGNGPAPSH